MSNSTTTKPASADGSPRCAEATGSVAPRPGDRGVWSIGDPGNPTPDDAMCGTEEAARNNARQLSGLDRVVAVWHGCECVCLYFEAREFRPA